MSTMLYVQRNIPKVIMVYYHTYLKCCGQYPVQGEVILEMFLREKPKTSFLHLV